MTDNPTQPPAGSSPVSFTSNGKRLAARLYRARGTDVHSPVIVMAHGYAAPKEWLSGYAERFAIAGLTSLVFDYPNFGESEGEPRQELDPWEQVRAFRDAVTFARGLDGIDPERLGAWGTSFSGAHVLVTAAVDRRVKAVVAQVPLTHGWPHLLRAVEYAKLGEMRAGWDAEREARLAGRAPAMLALTANDPGEPAAFPDPESWSYNERHRHLAPAWRNEVTVRSLDMLQESAPEAYAERIAPTPLLIIAAKGDLVCPHNLTMAFYERAYEPKRLVLVEGGHYAAYEERFEEGCAAATAWFSEHL